MIIELDKRTRERIEQQRRYQKMLTTMIHDTFTWYEQDGKRDVWLSDILPGMDHDTIVKALSECTLDEIADFIRLLELQAQDV